MSLFAPLNRSVILPTKNKINFETLIALLVLGIRHAMAITTTTSTTSSSFTTTHMGSCYVTGMFLNALGGF